MKTRLASAAVVLVVFGAGVVAGAQYRPVEAIAQSGTRQGTNDRRASVVFFDAIQIGRDAARLNRDCTDVSMVPGRVPNPNRGGPMIEGVFVLCERS